MSDATFDRGVHFSSSMIDWSRERPFKVAFAVSVLIHALLIAFIPGFRSVPVETPRILEVQITPQEPPAILPVPVKPVVPPKVVEPRIEPKPEPVARAPQPEPVVQEPKPTPEPVVKQPQPEPPPVPRAEIIRAVPRSEPTPEFVVPKPELRPEPKAEPKLEARPEPKIEPRPEPPPLARVEPRPEPRPTPRIEPRPEPRVEPKTEIRQEVKPVPADAPPPVAARRVEPSVAAPTVAPPPASAPVAAQPPPVVAPQPKVVAPQPQPQAADDKRERTLMDQYEQIISAKIRQFEEYPPVARRRHWEGTTVVQLRVTPEGKVTDITVVEKSGYDVLDEAAMKMIRKASPLPAPPEGLRDRDRTVLVPIKFRLDS
jgi:protein TonB